MPDTELRIPDSHKRALRTILDAEDGQLETMLAALRELPRSIFLSSSAEFLSEKAQLEEPHAARLLTMISSLYQLQEQPELDLEKIQQQVVEAADRDGDFQISDAQRARLAHFLKEALSLDSTLGVTSRAWSVARDYERTFCHSRILTEFRPVFRSSSEEPAALVISHSLRVSYHIGDRVEDFFVSLTPADVERLSSVLERAVRKEAKLRTVAEATGLPILEAE